MMPRFEIYVSPPLSRPSHRGLDSYGHWLLVLQDHLLHKEVSWFVEAGSCLNDFTQTARLALERLRAT